MGRKKDYFKNFRPFQHDNLGYKQALYKLAQESYAKKNVDEGIDYALSSALLNASIADYMGLHLLMSLRVYIKELSQYASKGLFFSGSADKSFSVPISRIISELEDYTFPMKSEILEHMIAIKDSRNRLFHEMMLIEPADTPILDRDVEVIAKQTEALVNKIDLLYSNFPTEGQTEEEVRGQVQENPADSKSTKKPNKTK